MGGGGECRQGVGSNGKIHLLSGRFDQAPLLGGPDIWFGFNVTFIFTGVYVYHT